ncbi:helix-turn-helix domain-containing protein [Mucilaginibacter sp.]|uniref:helix-turn-helix domain-containing protein n=1 Tax=Mucilaginibacter sp. TaxID=1882438 RepID=UPI00374D182E
MPETIHIGRKIKRIRELRGLKQEVLASELGISQKMVSVLEKSETIGDEKLKQIADVLGVSVEAIKDFNEEMLVFHIQNMHDNATAYQYNFQCNYNPLDKVVELYERLLQSEREKSALMGNRE